MIRIPIPNISFSTSTVNPSGISHLFTFRYNTRSQRWKLDIATAEGVTIHSGMSLINGLFLNSHLYMPEFADGVLMVQELEVGDLTYPSRDNFGIGKQFELVYMSLEELEALNG